MMGDSTYQMTLAVPREEAAFTRQRTLTKTTK